MEAINLKSITEGQTVNGLVLVTDYSPKTDFTSKAPLNGTVQYKGKTVKFKIWAGHTQNFFNEHDLVGAVLNVTGTVGSYNGEMDITFTIATPVNEEVDRNIFYKTADTNALFAEFGTFVGLLSPAYMELVQNFFNAEKLFIPFQNTWAGKKMHDAQVGGLLNHTVKMLRLANTLLVNDVRLRPHSDILLVSIMLHDIGKVYEMGEGGIYTQNSFVTHRTLGVEMASRHKQLFLDTVGEEAFYHIIAVMQGHHGEFGDAPTTIWAKIIHLIDMLEAHTTGFLDQLENGTVKVKNGNETVWSGTDLVVRRAGVTQNA